VHVLTCGLPWPPPTNNQVHCCNNRNARAPVYETWLEYPNYSALDEDYEKTKDFAKNPESNNCRHVKFALNLPEVQEILQKKGWKIPE
jgi:hypothetical protein